MYKRESQFLVIYTTDADNPACRDYVMDCVRKICTKPIVFHFGETGCGVQGYIDKVTMSIEEVENWDIRSPEYPDINASYACDYLIGGDEIYHHAIFRDGHLVILGDIIVPEAEICGLPNTENTDQ